MPNRSEKVASEVLGAVKATKAKIEGLTGGFSHLAREHGEVTALLLRVKSSSDPKVRAELWPKIREELLGHETGERTAVYPVFRQHSELAEFAAEHDREADELERRIQELTITAYDFDLWPARFGELVDLISAHVKEEEGEFFPAASKLLGREKTEQMLGDFERAKAASKNRVS